VTPKGAMMSEFAWPAHMAGLKAETRGPEGQYACFVYMTPSDARAILDAGNTKNIRPVTARRVTEYREIMDAGLWSVGSQAITFDEDGRLTNGQHRLSALAMSTIDGLWFMVVFCSSRSDEKAMDTGLGRTITVTHGVSRTRAATVRAVLVLGKGNVVIPRHVIESVASKHATDLDLALKWAEKVPGGAGVFAAAAFCALVARPGNRAQVCENIRNLVELDLQTPQQRIVKRWMDSHAPLSSVSPSMRLTTTATLIRGIEICLKKEPASLLKGTDSHPWAKEAADTLWAWE
jgi:hypothetical protein